MSIQNWAKPNASAAGFTWYWVPGENPASARHRVGDELRLLAPFDPVVWDRRRFEAFWGWAYRFEAYTPAPARKLGYYALPLLWRDQVIGWGNLSVDEGRLNADIGHVSGRAPRDKAFRVALDAELGRDLALHVVQALVLAADLLVRLVEAVGFHGHAGAPCCTLEWRR